jgi:tRNA threonylcarbamoyladenosine biosynthesis protein TsaB
VETGSILAIDAAGHACSVALWRRGSVAANEHRAMSHGQAAELLPMVERVIEAGAFDLREVAEVAVSVGPGGFTGLRIGLATARGLALAIGCPVVGISSFQATAAALLQGGLPGGDILVALDSRRAEPYLARLGPDLTFRQSPKLMDAAEIAAACRVPGLALVCGDGLDALGSLLPAELSRRPGAADARAVARLAADPTRRFNLPADPHYLRPPDISQPKARPAPPLRPA